MDYEELARRLVIRWMQRDREEFAHKEDLVSGEDHRKIVEEIDSIINSLKEEKSYKKKAEELQARLHYLHSLEDCDEEFEL